jgi:tetratricopeptide (TPR) repeat protein
VAHDVFLSYAHEDEPVADAVCATLESHGVRCWIAPRDVLPGRPYAEAIEDAVTIARLMVVVFSPHAARSVAVRSEVHLGFSRELTIIPFRLQDAPLAKGMNSLLGAVHWLDAITPPLEKHLRTLAERVREHLGPSPQTSAPKPDRSSHPEARACHDRGVALYHRQEFADAIAELTRAIELDPTVAWAFNDRGLAHFQRSEFDQAIRDLTRGITLDPTRAWAWHGRACAHSKGKDWDAAIRDFTEAIRCDPTVACFFHDRGTARLERHDYLHALEDFTQAILLNPEMEWAYRNRAVAYEKLNETRLAQADRAAARQWEPSSDETRAILYRNRRGQSILMVQTFARDLKWPEAVYHISQPGGERRPFRCCLRVFGNRLSPVAEETKESCIANAIENILDLIPDVVGLGGMGATARRIRAGLVGRGFKGKIDFWGGGVTLDAAEFLSRNEVEPPY